MHKDIAYGFASWLEDKFRDKLYEIELDSGQIISTFIYPKRYCQNTMEFSPLYEDIANEGIRL